MPFPNRNGRPSKLTPETHEKILNYLRVGCTHKMTAHMVGVDEDTFSTWYRTKPEFRRDVLTAEQESKTVLLVALHKQARNGSVQAATWLLERRGGPDFAPPKQQVEVTLDVSALSDEELTQIAAAGPPALTEVTRAS